MADEDAVAGAGDDAVEVVVEYGSRRFPLLHLVSPLVTTAAVWAARQAITTTYRRASGRTPPDPNDPTTSWPHAIAWTALTVSTAAVIEVAVRRLASERRVLRVLRRRRGSTQPLT